MASNPSSVFYWNDWVLDPALRLCSMAARGFWMEMLAIAASATPHGYVRVGDKPCTIYDLAHITGQDRRSVSRWVRELEQNGVFSRDDLGIFCRRMVHEGIEQNRQKSKKKTRTPRARDSVPEGDPQDSSPFLKPESSESPCGAREEKISEGNPQARCARLSRSDGRRFADQESPGINETPARMGLVGANLGGTDDAATSLPPPVADYTRFGSGNQGRAYPLAGSASSPSNRLGALRGGDAEVAQVVERCVEHAGDDGSTPSLGTFIAISHVCHPAHAPPCKSPALRAKIKEQLAQKHARFLMARKRPEEVAAYWAAMLSDDPELSQRMFDITDAQMRAAGWDDMRQWKAERRIAV